jgi:hypothetical protein
VTPFGRCVNVSNTYRCIVVVNAELAACGSIVTTSDPKLIDTTPGTTSRAKARGGNKEIRDAVKIAAVYPTIFIFASYLCEF